MWCAGLPKNREASALCGGQDFFGLLFLSRKKSKNWKRKRTVTRLAGRSKFIFNTF